VQALTIEEEATFWNSRDIFYVRRLSTHDSTGLGVQHDIIRDEVQGTLPSHQVLIIPHSVKQVRTNIFDGKELTKPHSDIVFAVKVICKDNETSSLRARFSLVNCDLNHQYGRTLHSLHFGFSASTAFIPFTPPPTEVFADVPISIFRIPFLSMDNLRSYIMPVLADDASKEIDFVYPRIQSRQGKHWKEFHSEKDPGIGNDLVVVWKSKGHQFLPQTFKDMGISMPITNQNIFLGNLPTYIALGIQKKIKTKDAADRPPKQTQPTAEVPLQVPARVVINDLTNRSTASATTVNASEGSKPKARGLWGNGSPNIPGLHPRVLSPVSSPDPHPTTKITTPEAHRSESSLPVSSSPPPAINSSEWTIMQARLAVMEQNQADFQRTVMVTIQQQSAQFASMMATTQELIRCIHIICAPIAPLLARVDAHFPQPPEQRPEYQPQAAPQPMIYVPTSAQPLNADPLVDLTGLDDDLETPTVEAAQPLVVFKQRSKKKARASDDDGEHLSTDFQVADGEDMEVEESPPPWPGNPTAEASVTMVVYRQPAAHEAH
jgi:hypothetical protein